MARHPWVAAADEGVRFGVGVLGQKGFTALFPEGGLVMYDEPLAAIVAAARDIEALGFDSVFVADNPHVLPDPLIAMTAIATATSRVRIGSGVLVTAFRHPALVARMVADIDRLSGGRVVLGVGIGESEEQFSRVEARWGSNAERRTALGEALEIISGSWGVESFTYRGRYYRTDNMHVVPGPLQQPHPPIMIGGSGDRTLAQVARRADACNLLYIPVEQVRARLDYLDRCCDAVGRPREEVLRSYLEYVVLAPTSAEAEAKLHRSMTAARVDSMEAAGILYFGTPDAAVVHYRALIDAGVQYVIVAPPDTADHETLHLLANEVIPHLHA
jgi:alkanesulfonate monooxygenase SsuD/methylene tetrahydromethanopterin reductase-like flavin-dependent oxidoreductase (luciferase family)